MKKSKVLRELEEVFGGWDGIKIEDCGENSHIRLDEKPFAIYYTSSKGISVLKVPVFRREFGDENAKKYEKALDKLKEADYGIRRYDFLGPHLLRVVT